MHITVSKRLILLVLAVGISIQFYQHIPESVYNLYILNILGLSTETSQDTKNEPDTDERINWLLEKNQNKIGH